MRPDKRPLISYLRVQEHAERELLFVLKRAQAAAEREMKALLGDTRIGATIRREQLELVRRALLRQQADLWRQVGSIVKAAQAEAAAAAMETMTAYTEMLLRGVDDVAKREELLRAAHAQAERGLKVVQARLTGLSNIALSQQVYRTHALANGWIDRIIENALATGMSRVELAKHVSRFINPNVRGGVSYAAKRLARTEINNAYHAVAVKQGIDDPYIVGMRWNLSGSHPVPDECNDYAEKSHFKNGDPGVFKPEDVPRKPHPNCLCYMTPEVVDDDTLFAMIQ